MYYLSAMNTYLIFLVCAHVTCVQGHSYEDIFNVGTVLFTSADLNKKRWDKKNIELLEARKHLQNLIPPPSSINTLNENYINTLLDYFRNAVSTAKRELKSNPELYDIMERALSDTIGGFLKVWVLPVTKYAYYGGTVSQENAVKVFQYYEDIKRHLNTNGRGWKNASDAVLNSIAVSVVPYSHETFRRSMKKNPCEHLAYYERFNNGLTIATPYINWVDNPSTMFLPLKNGSLILLDSPNSSNALINYYNIAEGCSHAHDPEGYTEFDERFQNWLSTDVVPHLNDDKLYVAFGSVLGLLNKTKQLFGGVGDDCDHGYETFREKSILAGFPPSVTSKKFLILSFVLFLEIIWCIPTLLYMICSRKKTKPSNRTQFFLDVFKRRKFGGDKCQTIGRIDNTGKRALNLTDCNQKSYVKICQPRKMDTGVRLIQKPRVRSTEADTQCPSHTSKRSIGQVTESFSDVINNNDSVTVIHEKPTKSSLKKKTIGSNTISSIQLQNSCNTTDQTSPTESFSTVQNLDTTRTKTIIKDKRSCDRKQHNMMNKNNRNGCCDEQSMRQSLEENTNCLDNICPCTRCIDEDKRNTQIFLRSNCPDIESKHKIKNETGNFQYIARIKKVADSIKTTRLPKLKHTRISVPEDVKANTYLPKIKGLRLNTGEPTLEIRIDRPAAEIKVDITKCNGSSRAKPSKIPRRTAICNAMENYQRHLISPATKHDEKQQKYKLVEKRAADDNLVRKVGDRRKKLNVTL